jgi:hypothetical protein
VSNFYWPTVISRNGNINGNRYFFSISKITNDQALTRYMMYQMMYSFSEGDRCRTLAGSGRQWIGSVLKIDQSKDVSKGKSSSGPRNKKEG